MTRRTKKKRQNNISPEKARQMLKVVTVLLRDESVLSFEEIALQLAYCWRYTESVEESVKREGKGQ